MVDSFQCMFHFVCVLLSIRTNIIPWGHKKVCLYDIFSNALWYYPHHFSSHFIFIPWLVCLYSFSFLNSMNSSMCTNMFDLKIIIACLLLTSIIHSDLSCSCILYVTCQTYFDQYNKLVTKLHVIIVSDEAEFDIFDPIQLLLWVSLDLH